MKSPYALYDRHTATIFELLRNLCQEVDIVFLDFRDQETEGLLGERVEEKSSILTEVSLSSLLLGDECDTVMSPQISIFPKETMEVEVLAPKAF